MNGIDFFVIFIQNLMQHLKVQENLDELYVYTQTISFKKLFFLNKFELNLPDMLWMTIDNNII